MTDTLLVVNVGSSSLKFALYDADEALPLYLRGSSESLATGSRWRLRDHQGGLLEEGHDASAWSPGAAVERVLRLLQQRMPGRYIAAVGHRVVHGGMHHALPAYVDAELLDALRALEPLAPLHQPHNLAAIERIAAEHPGLPQVACFDTAFHRSAPDLAQRYALPDAMHQAGIRRYGFHGLSCEWIAGSLATLDPAATEGRTIILHLGNGASLCALEGGRSIATSMGFSALDGLPMATRCGGIDPGVLLHLLRSEGMDVQAVEDLLYRRSGLLGISGISGDMRVLEASPEPAARIAIDYFVYRIQREVGSLLAALGGLDSLVFTAGIGENASRVRAAVLQGLAWTGVQLDAQANQAHGPRISSAGSPVRAWVLPTDEERVIAGHVWRLVGGGVGDDWVGGGDEGTRTRGHEGT